MARPAVVVGLVVGVAAAGAGLYLRPIAPVATGYAAQIVCGATQLQGRTVDDALGDLPSNPLVPLLRVREDGEGVRATLLGLAPSRAERVPGAGCRLVDDDARPVAAVAGVDVGVDDLVVPADATAAATAAGLDAPALGEAVAKAFDEDLLVGTKGTRAVVVVHGGEVVAERYAAGFDEDTPLLGWSMAKSVTHAMVGRLVLEDLLALGDDDLLPGRWTDERATITLEQLLRMSSGLAFEEVYDPGTDATEMLFTPRATGAYAAAKPLTSPPGSVWSYSSGTTNIVCDVATGVIDGPPAAAARDLVFAPLSMTSATMGLDAAGLPVCSSFGYATARDWARFGQWYLQDGVWGGERLLPEGWVAHAATPVDLPTVDEGELTPYGAQWWLNADRDGALRYAGVPNDAFWASGNEGQQVVVLPSHDTVVVRLGLTRDLDGADWGLEDLVAGVVAALP